MKVYTYNGQLHPPFAVVYYNGQGDLAAGPMSVMVGLKRWKS